MLASNVGSIDRIVRVVLGLALIAFAYLGPADITWKWAGYLGVIPILTAVFSMCPLYGMFDLSTKSGRSV